MSMKRVFSMLAALSLAVGAGFASLPVQAKPPAPIAATTAPTLGSELPVVVPRPNLVEARYWRYRYHYHRYHWRRHYHYRRWHYRRWHYRHYRY